MPRTFRFPIPREEQLLILAAAVVAPVILAVLAAMLVNLAAVNGMTLVELLNSSRGARAAIAGMLLVYIVAIFGAVAFARVKNGAELTIGETIRFFRPGAPLTGLFARDVELELARVDRFSIARVRRGAVDRVEVALGAGHDEILLNLGHAVEGEEGAASSAILPRDEWRTRPLVLALQEALDMEPTV